MMKLLKFRLSRSATLVAFAAGLTGCAQTDPSVRFLRSDTHTFSWAERRAITKIAVDATREARRLLPSLPAHIELTVRAGTDVIAETGETGTAIPPASIIWTVDHTRSGGAKGVAVAWLRASLFHEFHHLVRSTLGVPLTILDRAVFEGSATIFERDFAGVSTPWGAYPVNVQEWAVELLAVPPDANVRDWIYAHPDGRRWIGMRVGAYWVDRAIASSGQTAAELALLPTDQIMGFAGATK